MPVKGLKNNAIKTSIETMSATLAGLVALRLALERRIGT